MAGAVPVAPKKKSNKTLLIVILVFVGFCVLACGGLVIFGMNMLPLGLKVAACGINYSSAQPALRAYAEEHEGKLPPADNWQAELEPYYAGVTKQTRDGLKDAPEFVRFDIAPAAGPWTCASMNPPTTLAYNSEVAGKKLDELNSDDVVFFDVTTSGPNQSMKYEDRGAEGAPKFIDNKTGWTTITADGTLTGPMKSQSSTQQFKLDYKDGLQNR